MDNKPEILYIVGAGRSGTTLVDILLGNMDGFASCGELNRYGKRNGIPPQVDKNSKEWRFWSEIKEEFIKLNGKEAIKELKHLSDQFEYHKGYIKNKFILAKTDFRRYTALNSSLLICISKAYNHSKVLIDSSKYPGRLFWLSAIGFKINAVYIKRNPVDVVKSFQKKDVEQPSKNWLLASIYCYVVALLVAITKKSLKDKLVWVDVDYSELTNKPANALKPLINIVNKKEVEKLSEDLENRVNLNVGNLFDGNRIRLKHCISLLPSRQEDGPRESLKYKVIMWMNSRFYP